MMYRNTFQMGGAADDSRQQLYEALMQKGVLGQMSYEEFQAIPPDQLRQMMQQIQAQMQGGAQQGPQQGPPQMQLGGPITKWKKSGYNAAGTTYGRGMYDNGGDAYMGPLEDEPEDPQNALSEKRSDRKIGNQLQRAENRANFDYAGMGTGMMQGSGALTGVAGAAMMDKEKGAGSAQNVAGGVLSGVGSGMAAAGPMGAVVGGIGAAADVLGGASNKAATANKLDQASNIGTTGTSLNPLVAAYGVRTPGRAEQYMVDRMRNRANNPYYVSNNTSGNLREHGTVGRAGYQLGTPPEGTKTGGPNPMQPGEVRPLSMGQGWNIRKGVDTRKPGTYSTTPLTTVSSAGIPDTSFQTLRNRDIRGLADQWDADQLLKRQEQYRTSVGLPAQYGVRPTRRGDAISAAHQSYLKGYAYGGRAGYQNGTKGTPTTQEAMKMYKQMIQEKMNSGEIPQDYMQKKMQRANGPSLEDMQMQQGYKTMQRNQFSNPTSIAGFGSPMTLEQQLRSHGQMAYGGRNPYAYGGGYYGKKY